MKSTYQAVTVAMLLSVLANSANAKPRTAGEQIKMNINISGTVVATGHCEFNNQGTLTVDFGEVRYSTTGNSLFGTYLRPLVSDMTCTGDTQGSATMTLSSPEGSTIQYNGHKVLNVAAGATKTSGLGIALLVNGQMQDVDTAFAWKMANPPTLSAQLVQADTGKLLISGDKIISAATLTMAFD